MPKRFLPLILFPVVLLFAGCATRGRSSRAQAWTLETNRRAPTKIIEQFYEGAAWDRLKNLKYDGYVIFSGTVLRNQKVHLGRISEAFPDDSRNELARNFAHQVRLQPNQVGSRIPAGAFVYVFFYETDVKPRQALVVAEQEGVAPTELYYGTTFLTVFYY